MKRSATGACLEWTLLASAALACSTPPAAPPAPRDELSAKIEAVCAEWNRPDSPGCAVGVIRAGELVYAHGFGMANLEHAIPNGPAIVYDLGSTSKQFTAACVLLLEQDGALALDDDVRKWVPELPDYGTPITIRHLLHHTSGLRDYLTLFVMAGIATEDLTTQDDALAMVARQQALNFEPGAEHLYSNSNYLLLSVIVERVARKPLAEFAHERIFEPLGMSSTHVHGDHRRIVRNRATGYSSRDNGGFAIDMSDFEQTGDGAVMSTLEDLARWDANFYEPTVGGQALVDGLRTKGTLNDGQSIDYARGLSAREVNGLPFEAHGGAWAGYRAQLLRFPTRRVSIVCLCNLGDIDPNAIAWPVAAAVLGDELGRKPAAVARDASQAAPAPPPAPSADEAAAYVGAYESRELRIVYEVTVADGVLGVGVRGKSATIALTPSEHDVFSVLGARVAFQRGADGRVSGFTIGAGRVRDIRFTRCSTP